MEFHVLTLFPDMIRSVFSESITGRAAEKGLLSLNAVNIRDFSKDPHHKVDDYVYGGGAGMLMFPQPVYDAFRSLDVPEGTRVICPMPAGKTFDQKTAKELAKEERLVFLCGHYEGIDERVIDRIVTDRISIGDYVVTGGELPALLIMDAVSRMIPGVLGNDISFEEESFYDDLLEYPQYSRPEEWEGSRVPGILLSGDHKKVEEWRLEESIRITKELRPDLYEKWAASHPEYFEAKAKKEEKEREKALKKAKMLAKESRL
ncbi:MAG: tRNA (guanosine(37)-N1)-methyltransferase TrmD [Lachnospiraceae bacterium]|nr:tRNA (guanosine(37)-N1)-methyltransferase TrmD [Lachnospiraceae bacterium]